MTGCITAAKPTPTVLTYSICSNKQHTATRRVSTIPPPPTFAHCGRQITHCTQYGIHIMQCSTSLTNPTTHNESLTVTIHQSGTQGSGPVSGMHGSTEYTRNAQEPDPPGLPG